MKKNLVAIFCLLSCLFVFGFAHVVPQKPVPSKKLDTYAEETVIEDETNDPHFSVFGYSSKILTPDIACISANLETQGESFDLAVENQKTAYQNLVDDLAENGIEKSDIELICSTSFADDFWLNHQEGRFLSVYNFAINVKNLNNLQNISNVLVENNVKIMGIKYLVSNIDEEYSMLVDSAIENARARAFQICNRDDLQVVDIREKSVLFKSDYSLNELGDKNKSVNLKAKVRVIFQ